MDDIKPIIVHCRIFKNAGTTFDWSLSRYFGEGFVNDQNSESFSPDYLIHLLKAKNYIRALSNHHVRLTLPEYLVLN